MRSGWMFLGGLVMGLGLGLLLADGDDAQAVLTTSDGRRAPETGDTMRGLAGQAGGTREASPFGANAPVTLRGFEARLYESVRREGRGFEALAVLYALAGREDFLLQLIDVAIESGVDPDRVLDAITELPRDRRGAVMATVLDRYPNVDFDDYDVARIFERSGDPARALEIVRRALPLQDEFNPKLVRLLLRLDPMDGPALLLGTPGAESWGSEDLKSLRGFLVASGQAASLRPFLTRVLDADPGDEAALKMLARVDANEAVSRLREQVDHSPGDVGAWSLLGRLLEEQGDAEGAFSAFVEAAKRQPSPRQLALISGLDPERALPLIVEWTRGATDDEALGALALAYLRAGERDRALEVFQRAHEADPDDREWIDRLIDVDAKSAVVALERRIEPAPDAADEDLLGQYADALRAAGRKDEAFDQYLAAFRKDPDDHDWQLSMAEVDPKRALTVLEEHVAGHPDDASGFGAYGVALVGVGRKDEALQHLEHALANGDAETWYDELARVDSTRAIDGLRERARRARNDEDLWGLLGYALEERGRLGEAREAFLRALDLDPASSEWARAVRDLR